MTLAAAYTGLIAFGWLTVFQLALAAGLPLGRLAWGGSHRVLSARLRLASFASALLTGFGVWIYAGQARLMTPVLSDAMTTRALWAFAVLFAVSVLSNLFGARGLERLHGVPIALICTGASVVSALG